MPDSAELLAVARLLAGSDPTTPSSDAQLRRAVSTAYYAVFHRVLRVAAERFTGPDQESTAAFSLLYRGFDHKRMKAVCEELQASTLKEKYKRHLRRTSLSQDMRDFAGVFPDLQQARHLADYHPTADFRFSDVSSLVDAAEAAIESFNKAPQAEQTDVLALLSVGIRS